MSTTGNHIPPLQYLKTAATAHPLLKTLGTTTFMFFFFWGYLYLLHHPKGTVTPIPMTPIDQWIPFSIIGLPIYLSLWVYVSLPTLLIRTAPALILYGLRVATPCLVGLAIFYFYPTMIVIPPTDWQAHPSIAFLKKVDAAGNACPSLHVGIALYTGLWLHWRLRSIGMNRWIGWLNWCWCLGIIWSTMAIRQHLFLDVMGGIILALVTTWLTRLKAHAMRLT